MKCHAGVEFTSDKPCPKCGAGLGEVCWPGINADLQEVDSLRAQLASARKALEFIAEGYDNHDVNHVDYRVKVYQVATETLSFLQETTKDTSYG